MAEGPQIATRRTPSGHDTLTVDGRLVHSSRHPLREAQRALQELLRRAPPCVIILGLGLGYQAEVLLSGSKDTRVLVFEPSEQIVNMARKRGLNVSDPRLIMVSTPDALDQQLPLVAAGGYETLELQNRFATDSPDRRAATAALSAFASRLEINQHTLQRFGRLWVRNLCRNLHALAGGVGVSKLRSTLLGVPALLLAAGPSLDQVLPSLPALARRMAVVAVDTAVVHARAAGVEPDFAVVVDPQYWNARHLDSVTGTSALLVAETAAHPLIFRRFAPPFIFCSSVFPLGIRYEQRIGSFGQLGAGGSVSTTAWDLIRLMGASTVFAAGLDLGFPEGRTHCRGSFFEELAVTHGIRSRTAEGVVFRYIHGAHPHPVPDYHGGELLSDARMDVYRSWFERRLREEPLPTYMLSSISSRIEGTNAVAVASLQGLPNLRPEISERLARFRSQSRELPMKTHKNLHSLQSETDLLIRELDELYSLATAAQDEIAKITNQFASDGSVDFNGLSGIDARLLGSDSRGIASFLMQEAISNIQRGFGSRDISEQIEASRTLYDSLADSILFHRDQLSIARERMQDNKIDSGTV